MHVRKLKGAWTQHPFWKTRFVIDSTKDLQKLLSCGVAACWIDTALGLDEFAPEPAAASCHKGRGTARARFAEARMGRPVDAEQCLPLVEDISGSVLCNPGTSWRHRP
jgi:Domain of unknown function (DUF3391)